MDCRAGGTLVGGRGALSAFCTYRVRSFESGGKRGDPTRGKQMGVSMAKETPEQVNEDPRFNLIANNSLTWKLNTEGGSYRRR